MLISVFMLSKLLTLTPCISGSSLPLHVLEVCSLLTVPEHTAYISTSAILQNTSSA